MSMFEQASRLKIRFDTPRGFLTVEDLWDLPLTSTTGKPNLDDIAKGLNRSLRVITEETSFVESPAPKDDGLQVAFDIVKHIIAIKVAERTAANDAAKKRETKQKIMAIMESKKNEALAGKSLEELEAMLQTM